MPASMFGIVALSLDLLNSDQLHHALSVQKWENMNQGTHRRLGEICVSLGYMTDEDVQLIIDRMRIMSLPLGRPAPARAGQTSSEAAPAPDAPPAPRDPEPAPALVLDSRPPASWTGSARSSAESAAPTVEVRASRAEAAAAEASAAPAVSLQPNVVPVSFDEIEQMLEQVAPDGSALASELSNRYRELLQLYRTAGEQILKLAKEKETLRERLSAALVRAELFEHQADELRRQLALTEADLKKERSKTFVQRAFRL